MTVRNPAENPKRRWVMQATREWSQDFLEQTPEWAMRELQQALHEILPNPFEISQGAIHRCATRVPGQVMNR